MKAKLHKATVTEADIDYEGSLTVDKELLDAVGMKIFERVHVYNITNGERFETYLIEGVSGSGTIGLNGAAARKGMKGDKIIIVAYCLLPDNQSDHFPQIALLDEQNKIKEMISK
ncbi:MAG: aspartate 1-decarboxylase [Desulfobulbaceae bacterium]|nr:MAG: aspartate 1-decarboxylase [Desulfobulbaceae bacterium]